MQLLTNALVSENIFMTASKQELLLGINFATMCPGDTITTTTTSIVTPASGRRNKPNTGQASALPDESLGGMNFKLFPEARMSDVARMPVPPHQRK